MRGYWWAVGLTPAEREPGPAAPAPAWAADVEQALADFAPPSGEPPVGSWLDAFAWALAPLVPKDDPEVAVPVSRKLAELAARTLVLELNAARVRGELSGDTGPRRFTDFVRRLGTRAGLETLCERYPVLARLLAQAGRAAAEARAELLARFQADRRSIVDTLLGADPGALVEVETGLGDGHRGGRGVAVLRFADGRRLVYKPRPLAVHVHFTGLVQWLNRQVPGLELATVAALDRGRYGWLEYIADQPCQRLTDVWRFYRRQGALIALLYAVDAADVHYENLIARGDQPVLVDLETLFHPDIPPPGQVYADPAAAALAASVLRTHLLPQMIVGEHGTLDVSGLGGDRGGLFPSDRAGWDLPATDRMRLTRAPVPFTGARNRPRLDGRDQDPVDFLPLLLSGFRAGYDAIVRGRTEFLAHLEAMASDEIRVVPRPTAGYVQLLSESTHPDLMRDAADRDRVLDTLRSSTVDDPYRLPLVPHELADLWAGDVPLFTARPESRDLYSAAGCRLPDLLPVAGLTSVRGKVASMGEVDRRDQEWLISAAVATRRPWPGPEATQTVPGGPAGLTPEPGRLLAAACGLADQLAARALYGGDAVNWVGLELVEDIGWSVRQLGAGLAGGYCGVALFLAQLAALTGVGRYRDLARYALRPVPALLAALRTQPELARAVGGGGFDGLGGIAYALARVGTLVEDEALHELAAEAVALATIGAAAGSAGVLDGWAGGLAAMTAVGRETGCAAAGELARDGAERLSTVDTSRLPAGFAEGALGVGWALLRFAAAGGGERYRRIGRDVLGPIDRWDGRLAGPGWHSGTSGLLIAYAHAAEAPTGLERRVDALLAQPPRRDVSSCHGELGIAEALGVLVQHGYGERMEQGRLNRAGLILRALDRYGPQCGVPGYVSTPGLLCGLAGIGYGLLRLGFVERVPSVLLLEPTPPGWR